MGMKISAQNARKKQEFIYRKLVDDVLNYIWIYPVKDGGKHCGRWTYFSTRAFEKIRLKRYRQTL